jgi:hypothetical protein
MSMMSGLKGPWLMTQAVIEDVRDIARFERLERERQKDCARLVNGLHAIRGHCDQCDVRIRTCHPIEYRIRDNHGNVITADWVGHD